jgi:hypothetical protein
LKPYGKNTPEGLRKIRSSLNKPLVKKIFEFTRPWRISGVYSDAQVEIRTHVTGGNNSKQTYLRYIILFDSPLSFEVQISRESFGSKIGKTIGVLQDILVGDSEFDSAALVRGESETQVLFWLNDSKRKQTIQQLLEKNSRVVISRKGVQLDKRVRSGTVDYHEAKKILDEFVPFAQKVEGE